jgi:hypothetical protein
VELSTAGRRLLAVLLLLLLPLLPGVRGHAAGTGALPGESIVVDAFEEVAGWSAHPADGVELSIAGDGGFRGKALRLDFRFREGGGYAVARKAVSLELPDNYRFRFRIRGAATPNHVEFKLIDATGENVWWSVRRDYRFPESWESFTIKKRQVAFAWGPAGGGEIRSVASIEIAITAGSGGQGTVWIDELTLEGLPPVPSTLPVPTATASSSRAGGGPELAIDGDLRTAWSCDPGDRAPWLQIDMGTLREWGGLSLDWVEGKGASDYAVSISEEGASWTQVRTVRGGSGGRDPLYLPETESRYLRIEPAARATDPRRDVELAELTIQPLAWSASRESFFQAIARDAPRGTYPRGISGEQSYWTVVGVDRDPRELLLNEDGAIETGAGAFSIEPFVFARDRLWTWSDARSEASLQDGWAPAPTVRWSLPDLDLEVRACGIGPPESSAVTVRYTLRSHAAGAQPVILFLAARPFQVNPPSQGLNLQGGTAPLFDLALEDHPAGGAWLRAGGERAVLCLTAPESFGAVAFDGGEIVADHLRFGKLPDSARVHDPFGAASGALAYRRTLAPGATAEIDLVIPLHGAPSAGGGAAGADPPAGRCLWSGCTGTAAIELPAGAGDLLLTLRAQLAYILVNRAGPAIQPGTRAYARSWIRDGALTSSALLRLGCADAAREFVEWFAGHQYENGKVPCCVDARGADPVPEHDSSGELIFAVAEYYRYTRDRAALERMWPRVLGAAAYLDSLRQERRTPEYARPENRRFYGLLPPSISHEGYSAKPMHSYWDDFFALRGFRDAEFLAGELADPEAAESLTRIREEFEGDLQRSIDAAMEYHGIDFIPGCADLGDFDATSTAIAVSPVAAVDLLPPAALDRTFEKYWEFFRHRRDTGDWEAYTPYEMRTIGALVRLGQKERAHEMLAWFLGHRRPEGWRQWAEVVRKEERVPHFLGDMPHTWVGSEFVRSLLDFFAFEREEDRSIVLAAGIPESWSRSAEGVRVRDLPTPYGPLSYSIAADGSALVIEIEDGLRMPPGGLAIRPPLDGPVRKVTINGQESGAAPQREILVRELPAIIRLDP